jgi:cytochrome b6-f complex iron-sulfur subunit
MVCPCHAAEFNSKGEVTTGPAEINLKSFFTTTDNENIYIQL